MANSSFKKLFRFRESFSAADIKDLLTTWFPGHMHKGMVQMQKKLAQVDCIIEVHDARIPFSGRNPKFHSMLYAIKPHILVLNKMDLADLSQKSLIENQLKKSGVGTVLFTNLKGSKNTGVGKIFPTAVDLIKNSEQFNRASAPELCVMIIGIPNVGKSSLINRLRNEILRKGNATPVGAKPGITRSVLQKIKVSDSPPMFLLDTPGIMQPHIRNFEVGLRLALCCTLNDHVVGEKVIADYLLYWLNKHENFSYVKHLGIKEPVDNINALLFQVAEIHNKLKLYRSPEGPVLKMPDLHFAALYFISAFRNGAFGKVFLDDDIFNTP